MSIHVTIKETKLTPDFKKVIPRFFNTGNERAKIIIARVLQMPGDAAKTLIRQIISEFAPKYRHIESIFIKHYGMVQHLLSPDESLQITGDRKALIGAYFTMEYAIEAAALFNPSIVTDPDQSNALPGEKKVIISFRATGESHISSIVFRHGSLSAECHLTLDPPGKFMNEGRITSITQPDRAIVGNKLSQLRIPEDIHARILEKIGDPLSSHEIDTLLKDALHENMELDKLKIRYDILKMVNASYEIQFPAASVLSERVIFPITYAEKNGIEDARFVRFTNDDGSIIYYATYTAFDGSFIIPKLIETKDFLCFKFSSLHGKFSVNKNLALFPRKINGQYAMLSRIDGVNNYLMLSDDLYVWENAELLQQPEYPWEFVQIGNGGSPVETEKGWLIITHGVGPMRKYCLGATLLDLQNPLVQLGRLRQPLLMPNENEQHGYVPNVVYSCGSIVHGEYLFMPFAVSDYSSSFASMPLSALLDELEAVPKSAAAH
ncbi:glycoside hydrolase family 130 protein [Deminuibacter soli]|uniref:Glycosidase n=1 Tax=Deminuibacter soli TaxID=2291815 RepID=A0A3E1NNR8_9BACT|nr:glycoside hydrolase family 130 protein [Deminuibacter soli]RFM29563.1 glycosidase [Deminuibacter soli]